MKKFLLSLILLCASIVATSATNETYYRIQKITGASSIRIGGKTCTETVNNIFSSSATIDWPSEKVILEIYRTVDNAPSTISKKMFDEYKVKTLKDYYEKTVSAIHKGEAIDFTIKQGIKNKELYPESRIALVIGNFNYEQMAWLRQVPHDIEKVSSRLLELGFDVIETYDCDCRKLNSAINYFYRKAEEYDVALIYYSGHGLQYENRDYLLPTDFNREKGMLRDVPSIATILAKTQEEHRRNNPDIIVVDACRSTNFSWQGRGYSERISIEAEANTILLYSTASTNTANDDGIFASSFVKQIGSGEDIVHEFANISIEVNELSKGEQIPKNQSGLLSKERFYFKKEIKAPKIIIPEKTETPKANSTIDKTETKENPVVAPGDSRIHGTNLIDGHEYVDLGLPSGTLWATCNVGGEKPEDYGNYYAWGETSPKAQYTNSNYKFNRSIYRNRYKSSKYNGDCKQLILESIDDAAHVNWGGDWRMPTMTEFNELRRYCNWTWESEGNTEYKGIAGYKIQSKINDKSIFLPASGFRDDYDVNDPDIIRGIINLGKEGSYWTSNLSLKTDNTYSLITFPVYAYRYIFETTWEGGYFPIGRCNGFPIRPVISTKPKVYCEYVDLGLSVKWANCNLGARTPEDIGFYFAWGETNIKSVFCRQNYIGGKTSNNKNKYSSRKGETNQDILDLDDDAAHFYLGDQWRMPTKEEFEELIEKCIWTWYDGKELRYNNTDVQGYLVTSKVPGYEDNSIFLPCCWMLGLDYHYHGWPGMYWSSTNHSDDKHGCAHILVYEHEGIREITMFTEDKFMGLQIRPVWKQ